MIFLMNYLNLWEIAGALFLVQGLMGENNLKL